jgi:hypothetical protein
MEQDIDETFGLFFPTGNSTRFYGYSLVLIG